MRDMQRALQVLGLSGLFVVGFASRQARGQEPTEAEPPANTDADSAHNTEEPKEAEKPAPVFAPSATTPPPAAVPPAAPPPKAPKFGDMTVSGYFRGGFGASNQKGRMTCFSITNPAGLVSKYRLGNECEVWSETHFTIVTYAGDDGVVSTLHFMPTVYIPTTNIGYSPTDTVNSPAIFTTSTGATLSFPNLYVDVKGIPWLFGGTAWAGTRYYKRESVYISDFFYWNPSGVGGGIEDIHLGGDLRLSYAVFAVDGEPASPATGGTSRFGVLAQRLRQGGLVCLPTERDVTGTGIEVDFFGEKALMMGGPAALAVQTGAALMPVTLWFKPDGWGAHIHEEIPVPAEGTRREKTLAMMQEVAKVFEAGIREHPEDWHMLQRVFVADLDLARLARAQAKARAADAAGDGAGTDGDGTGAGAHGAGRAGPEERADGRAALAGYPDGGRP